MGCNWGPTAFIENAKKNGSKFPLKIECSAQIPIFAYGLFPAEVEVKNNQSGNVFFKDRLSISNESTSTHEPHECRLFILAGTGASRTDELLDFGHISQGKVELEVLANWTAPFKLDVSVKVPELPKQFSDIGDDAIATYYDYVRRMPIGLRRTTLSVPPRLGVLWVPTDESLYATGEIPEVEIPPRPKNDPVLVLDIPNGNISYRHVIAAWNIGEELPFKNWLSEYSEGEKS